MNTYNPNSNQQETPNQQGNPYGQANPYEQTNPYGQANPYEQANPYGQDNSYEPTNPYINSGYGNYGANSTPQKAPNIFKQFIYSFMPSRYISLIRVKTGSMIGFVILLSLLSTIAMFLVLALGFPTDQVKEWVRELPDFEIKNGQFSIEEDFALDQDGLFVYITDDIDLFKYDDVDELVTAGYDTILLIGRDNVSLMQDGKYQEHEFKDLSIDAPINKDWIINTLMPAMWVLVIVAFVVFFVGRIFWYFLCAMIYFLFALIISSILKKQQSAGALYRTAVYSKVLMFVVATILSVFPIVSIPLVLRIAITLGFMVTSIANLPTIINR